MKNDILPTDNFYLRLIAAKKEFKPIKKSNIAKGLKFDYNYADLEETLDAVQPALWSNQLDIQQDIIDNNLITFIVDCLNCQRYVYTSIAIEPVSGAGTNPIQHYGSAVTYLRRYSIHVALCLKTEDNDAQASDKVNLLKKPVVNKPPILEGINELKSLYEELKPILEDKVKARVETIMISKEPQSIKSGVDFLADFKRKRGLPETKSLIKTF